MLTHYYPVALRVLGCFAAILSFGSVLLLVAAPLPGGLVKLDPQALLVVMVVVLGFFGGLLPSVVVVSNPMKLPLLKAVIFAAASFANAVTLSPLVSVPLQDSMGLIAAGCALIVSVLSLMVYMDAAQRQLR